MYNKQEKKVLDLLRQVEVAFNDLIYPPTTTSGKKQHAHTRRNDGVVHDKDSSAFREGIAQLERNIKARAADRLNELDLSDYVKEAIKDNHPNAVDIDFKVTFTNQEVSRHKMEVTPSEYGGGVSTRMAKSQLDRAVEGADDDDDQEDDFG